VDVDENMIEIMMNQPSSVPSDDKEVKTSKTGLKENLKKDLFVDINIPFKLLFILNEMPYIKILKEGKLPDFASGSWKGLG